MPLQLDTGQFHADRRVIVRSDGSEVRLSPTEGRLLAYLADRPGAVVPYTTLLAEVWGYSPRVQSRTVFTTVNRLRPKIEADPRKPRHVLPVPGVGYRFVPADTPPGDAVVKAEDLRGIADRLGAHTRIRAERSEGGATRIEVDGVGVPAELAGTLQLPGASDAGLGVIRERLSAFLQGTWTLDLRSVAAGAVLVHEGERGHEAFIMVEGSCAVRRGEREVRRLFPGDVFGEVALLSSAGVRTATVVALTDAEVRVVRREHVTEGLGLDSWVGAFVAALADRFIEIEARP